MLPIASRISSLESVVGIYGFSGSVTACRK
jgi:hypothetical protein